VTAARHRLPIRVVVLATVVMTAAVVTAAAAVLGHCGLGTDSGAVEGPLTAWLNPENPEKVAGNGHSSGPGLRLAGPSEPLAGAG